eukprot:SAG11_NODE_385_length_9888_cov_13.326387_7_plen_247_part_00
MFAAADSDFLSRVAAGQVQCTECGAHVEIPHALIRSLGCTWPAQVERALLGAEAIVFFCKDAVPFGTAMVTERLAGHEALVGLLAASQVQFGALPRSRVRRMGPVLVLLVPFIYLGMAGYLLVSQTRPNKGKGVGKRADQVPHRPNRTQAHRTQGATAQGATAQGSTAQQTGGPPKVCGGLSRSAVLHHRTVLSPPQGRAPQRVVRFDDAAGQDGAKAELLDIVNFLQQPETYARVGAVMPKGGAT